MCQCVAGVERAASRLITTSTAAFYLMCCGNWWPKRKNWSAGLRPGAAQREAQTTRRIGDRRSKDMPPRTKRDSLRDAFYRKPRHYLVSVRYKSSGRVPAVLPDLVRSRRTDHYGVV